MSHAKRLTNGGEPTGTDGGDAPDASTATCAAPHYASFVRAHDVDEIDAQSPLSSSVGLEQAVDVAELLERWLARHFSLSVKLHDVQRAHEEAEVPLEEATAREVEAILADLGVAQGVLLELQEYGAAEPRVRAWMGEDRTVQHGIVAVYAWLEDTLTALARRAVSRRRASFVDDEEKAPPITMLSTLERLHPDLQKLVLPDALPLDGEVARKLALCFRQIGATIVRISGRASTLPPPAA